MLSTSEQVDQVDVQFYKFKLGIKCCWQTVISIHQKRKEIIGQMVLSPLRTLICEIRMRWFGGFNTRCKANNR